MAGLVNPLKIKLTQIIIVIKKQNVHLQCSSLLPVQLLPSLVGQNEVAGFTHLIQLVSIILQSYFIV